MKFNLEPLLQHSFQRPIEELLLLWSQARIVWMEGEMFAGAPLSCVKTLVWPATMKEHTLAPMHLHPVIHDSHH